MDYQIHWHGSGRGSKTFYDFDFETSGFKVQLYTEISVGIPLITTLKLRSSGRAKQWKFYVDAIEYF